MNDFLRSSIMMPLIGFGDALRWLWTGLGVAALFLAVDWLTRRRA